MSATINKENADVEVKVQSATGCGTHTRFYDDSEEAEKALTEITNKEQLRLSAKQEASSVTEEQDEEAAAEEEEVETAPEEENVEEEQVAAEEETEVDPKMAYRSVPSHFYEEAKVRDTKFCGTHTRFEDDEAEVNPLSAEESAKMDALADGIKDAMSIDQVAAKEKTAC